MEKRKRRKLFSALLLILSFSLIACGKRGDMDRDKDTSTSNNLSSTVGENETKKENSSEADNLESSILDTTNSEITLSATETLDEITSDSALPAVSFSYEILRNVWTNDSEEEFAYAEYPKFTVNGDGYKALSDTFDSINEKWQEQSKAFLDSAKEYKETFASSSYLFCQDTFVNVTKCDTDIVCVLVVRSVEEGGSHPNNYIDTYNINAKTGEFLELSDIITIDDTLKENIKSQLYENYPELDFDDTLVEQEISDALHHNTISWYFWEDQICIGFAEGSFGFSHAEGTLGVLLSFK